MIRPIARSNQVALTLLLVLLAAGLAPGPARAAVRQRASNTVRGRVTDQSGNPLGGAEVIVVELERRTTSDGDGSFTLSRVPAGRYTVLVRRAGYAAAIRQIDTASLGTFEIALDPVAVDLPAVVVTLTRSPVSARASPLPSDAISPAQLRRSHSVSLSNTLRTLPGIRSLDTGQQVGKPVIRGFSGSRVLVVSDGLRLEDYSWSDEDAPSIDARTADRVEVLRGPASLLYGSDALGGVVNVLPEPLPDALAGETRFRPGIELYAASNNAEVGTVLRGEGGLGPVGWRATVIGRRSESIHTPDGELENTGYAALNGELGAGMHGAWGSAALRYSRYGGEFKLLEKEGPPEGGGAGEEEGPERKLSDDRIAFSGLFPMGAFQLETKAQWQRHWLQELSDELDPEPGAQKREVPVFELLLNTLTADVMMHRTSDSGRLTVGVSAELQSNDSRGVLPVVPDAAVRDGAVFALQTLEIGKVTVLGGARVDARRIDPDPTKGLAVNAEAQSNTALAADLGIALRPTDRLSLKANVGRAWRAPNHFELYADGPRIGEARYEIGDPNLDPETSLAFDGGAQWEGRRATIEIAGFVQSIDDFIFLLPTDEFQDGLRVYEHGQAGSTMTGGEVSARLFPTQTLSFGAQYEYVRGTNDDTDEPLPWIPAPRARFDAELRGPGPIGLETGHVGAALEFVAQKTRLAPNETGVDSYSLLDLGLGIGTTWMGRDLRVDLAVHNALDESYRDFLNRYKDFALNAGRDITIRFALGS